MWGKKDKCENKSQLNSTFFNIFLTKIQKNPETLNGAKNITF